MHRVPQGDPNGMWQRRHGVVPFGPKATGRYHSPAVMTAAPSVTRGRASGEGYRTICLRFHEMLSCFVARARLQRERS